MKTAAGLTFAEFTGQTMETAGPCGTYHSGRIAIPVFR